MFGRMYFVCRGRDLFMNDDFGYGPTLQAESESVMDGLLKFPFSELCSLSLSRPPSNEERQMKETAKVMNHDERGGRRRGRRGESETDQNKPRD